MKKRIFLAVLSFSVVATMMLGGCAGATTGSSEPEVTVAEVVEEVKEETPKVEEPKAMEEVKEEKSEETKEVAEAPTKEESTETDEKVEKAEKSETVESKAGEAKASETKPDEATEVVTETVATESGAKAETTQVVETVQATSGYVIDKYIVNGSFTDHSGYGTEMGMINLYDGVDDHWNIFYYFDGYWVAVGTNAQDPTYAYVAIGKDSANGVTYCSLCDYTKSTNNVTVFSDGTFIPRETAYGLEKTINYMKSHPDSSQKPSIDGMTWIGWDEW